MTKIDPTKTEVLEKYPDLFINGKKVENFYYGDIEILGDYQPHNGRCDLNSYSLTWKKSFVAGDDAFVCLNCFERLKIRKLLK